METCRVIWSSTDAKWIRKKPATVRFLPNQKTFENLIHIPSSIFRHYDY